MKKLIQITSLSKSFGDQKVLDNIDFNLEKGEIVGLIGPSGLGKSTLIKTMLGMEKADKGEALVLDNKMPKREILSNVGYMAQSDALYEMLTGYENLEFFGLYTKSGAWKNSSPGFQFLYTKRQISNIIKVYKNN